MGMRCQSDFHGNRLPADLVEGVGESLELIVARTAGRTLSHVDFHVAGERLEKITGERHMIGNGLGIRSGSMKFVDWPISPLDASMNVMPASSKIFLSSIGFFRYLSMPSAYNSMPCSPMAAILLTAQTVIVLPSPDGTGGPEKNVRIDGVERLVRNRAPHLGWPHDTGSGCHAEQR